MLFDSQGVALPPTPAPVLEGETPDPQVVAMRRLANAMAELTQRGSKAYHAHMDTVRVPVADLFVVCQALYTVLQPQE